MSGRVFDHPPVLCGHRGMGSGVVGPHHENTIESFLAAVACGLEWVEIDVRTTADEVLVVSHFPTLADGRFFADVTGSECGPETVRLDDLLDALPSHVAVDLDIKSCLEDALRPPAQTTGAHVGRRAVAESRRRRVLLTSFDPAALLIAREHAPDVAAGLIAWVRFPLRKAIPAAKHLGLRVVAAHVGSFDRNPTDRAPVMRDATWSVDVAHRAGLEVVAWCPAAAEMGSLVAAGVDCLVVNDVPDALATLGASREGAVPPARRRHR